VGFSNQKRRIVHVIATKHKKEIDEMYEK